MLGRAFCSRRALVTTAGVLSQPHRLLISGMASNRTPRGMTPLAVRDSDAVVEELAAAYVDMDLPTMTAFHTKAMAQLLRTSPDTVPYEEQLLQAMGGGGGGAVMAVAAAAPPSPAAGEAASDAGAAAAAPAGKKAPEKTAFDITLKKFPAENKIKLIKELRSACGLGIQEAKTAIEKCPGVIARHMQTADAEKLKAVMVKLGAEVELT